MKTEYVRSLGLPQGLRVSQYENLPEIVKQAGGEGPVVDAVNKYLRQKSALVDGRWDLALEIEKLGFKPNTKIVKRDNKDVTEWDETEGQYIGRFITAAVKNTFTHPSMTITGTNEEQREAAVYAFLQTVANRIGTRDKDGKFVTDPPAYVLDIKVPESTGKPKKLPEYAIEGATNIINNKNEKAWADKFAKGYKHSSGVQIDPLTHDSFVTVAPKGAKPEEVEAVRKLNIDALAKAIVSAEDQARKKQSKQEYA